MLEEFNNVNKTPQNIAELKVILLHGLLSETLQQVPQ